MKRYIDKKYKDLYEECPMCKSKTFICCSWSEIGWGTVEVHGSCYRCGYMIEKCYSPSIECFLDIKKGFKGSDGEYVEKNIKRHKRIRRKRHIKGIEVNPFWAYMV